MNRTRAWNLRRTPELQVRRSNNEQQTIDDFEINDPPRSRTNTRLDRDGLWPSICHIHCRFHRLKIAGRSYGLTRERTRIKIRFRREKSMAFFQRRRRRRRWDNDLILRVGREEEEELRWIWISLPWEQPKFCSYFFSLFFSPFFFVVCFIFVIFFNSTYNIIFKSNHS